MKLSFCIPTYNRKRYLEETLKSILSQASEEIEIVISDNHSTDGTEEYVQQLQTRYPHLVYHQWTETVPCGDNLLKAVELGRGEYCWLMTDDDRVEAGGVDHVLDILRTQTELTGVSVNVAGYDRQLKEKKTIRYSHQMKQDELFVDAEHAFEKLGAWFGFWSAHIVHKKQWDRVVARREHDLFLGYHHLYIILAMLVESPRWFFAHKKCVGYRADNESFSQEYGRLKRFEIDAFSYTAIGLRFFPPQSVRKVNRIVIKKLLFWQVVTIKCADPSIKLLKDLFIIALSHYRSYLSFWCLLGPLLCIPRVWLLSMRFVYRLSRYWAVRISKKRSLINI